MLSEDEFEPALLKLKWHGCVDSEEANVLRAHDREQRAEIERLKILLDATLALHAFACAEIKRLGGSPPAPEVK